MGVPISTEADKNDSEYGPHDIIRKGLIKISNIPKLAYRNQEMSRTNVADDASRPGQNGKLAGHDKLGDWSTSSESLDHKGKKVPKVPKRPRTVTRPRTATLHHPAVLDITHAKTLDMSETNSRALLTSGKVSSLSFVRSDWYLNAGSQHRSTTSTTAHERANSLPRQQRPLRSVFRRGASDDAEFNLASSSESEINSFDFRCATAVKPKASVLQYFPHRQRDSQPPHHLHHQQALEVNASLLAMGAANRANNKPRARARSKTKQKRPKTIKLSKPTANLAIPHIGAQSFLGKKYPSRKSQPGLIVPPPDNIPEPCTTCGRPDHPERFHSHPAHGLRGLHPHNNKAHQHHGKNNHFHHEQQSKKSKDKGVDSESESPPPPRKPVRSVNKPVALKYHRKNDIRVAIQQKQKEKEEHDGGDAFIFIQKSQLRVNGVDENSNNVPHSPSRSKLKATTKQETSRSKERLHDGHESPQQSDSSATTTNSNSSREKASTSRSQSNKPPAHGGHAHGQTRIDTGMSRLTKRQPRRPPFRTVFNGTDDDVSDEDKPEKSPEPTETSKKEKDSSSLKDTSSLMTINLTDDLQNLNPGPPRVSTSVGGRPNSFVCYFCGREYGSRSLPIHAEACLNRWRRERDSLPANLKVPTPEPPPMEDPTENQKEWNRMAMEIHQRLTVPCPHCKRKFIMDRVALHVKSCAKNTRKSDMAPPTPTKRPPPHVPCHLCGRLFGTASIDIHIPQCLEKWERENAELPPHMRREPPQRPEFVFKENGEIDYEETQNVFWQSHMEQLVPCGKCGRTFFPDRLEKHAPNCQGQK